eukprot:1160929-Pelagomonas_calceolata.AAC.2
MLYHCCSSANGCIERSTLGKTRLLVCAQIVASNLQTYGGYHSMNEFLHRYKQQQLMLSHVYHPRPMTPDGFLCLYFSIRRRQVAHVEGIMAQPLLDGSHPHM